MNTAISKLSDSSESYYTVTVTVLNQLSFSSLDNGVLNLQTRSLTLGWLPHNLSLESSESLLLQALPFCTYCHGPLSLGTLLKDQVESEGTVAAGGADTGLARFCGI